MALDLMTTLAHARCPAGQLGIAIADAMDVINGQVHARCAYTVDNLLKPRTMLEIGFGGGGFYRQLRRSIPYIGQDISADMVREFNRRYGTRTVRAFQCGADHLLADRHSIECVVALNTIYWWDDLSASLKEIYRVLSPGSYLIIGCTMQPERDDIWNTEAHPPRHYTRDELFELLQASNFNVVALDAFDDLVTFGDQRVNREYEIIGAVAA